TAVLKRYVTKRCHCRQESVAKSWDGCVTLTLTLCMTFRKNHRSHNKKPCPKTVCIMATIWTFYVATLRVDYARLCKGRRWTGAGRFQYRPSDRSDWTVRPDSDGTSLGS